MLMVEALDAFEMLRKACLEAPVLALANFNKAISSWKLRQVSYGLGAMLSKKTD